MGKVRCQLVLQNKFRPGRTGSTRGLGREGWLRSEITRTRLRRTLCVGKTVYNGENSLDRESASLSRGAPHGGTVVEDKLPCKGSSRADRACQVVLSAKKTGRVLKPARRCAALL